MTYDAKFEIRNPQIEKTLREIGHSIGDKLPKGYGFTLMLFGFQNQDFFYISNAQREDMIRAMQEFIAKHREN